MNQLAINGGEPVSEETIPFYRPDLGDPEIETIEESINSKMVAGPGSYCKKVEKKHEQQWDIPRVLTTTSCTHALEIALLSLQLSESDEVIVPSFTYVSTALAVLRAGGTPIFADVNPDTYTLSVDTIKKELTPQTVAVVMVHYGGFPGPTTKNIASFCDRENLTLIEDAAQAYDSRINGELAGTLGRFGAISFHGTKSITCGEGGILLVNDQEDVQACEMIRDKGTDRSKKLRGDIDRYTWRSIGSSYVLSDILGAILWTQINRWPEIKSKKLRIQKKIRTILREIDEEDIFDVYTPPDGVKENGHMCVFQVTNSELQNWMIEALQREGIQALSHYEPLHGSPYARNELEVKKDLPVTETVSNTIIRLPLHNDLTPDHLDKIRTSLRKIYPHIID